MNNYREISKIGIFMVKVVNFIINKMNKFYNCLDCCATCKFCQESYGEEECKNEVREFYQNTSNSPHICNLYQRWSKVK